LDAACEVLEKLAEDLTNLATFGLNAPEQDA
jgi:hypothetical protein